MATPVTTRDHRSQSVASPNSDPISRKKRSTLVRRTKSSILLSTSEKPSWKDHIPFHKSIDKRVSEIFKTRSEFVEDLVTLRIKLKKEKDIGNFYRELFSLNRMDPEVFSRVHQSGDCSYFIRALEESELWKNSSKGARNELILEMIIAYAAIPNINLIQKLLNHFFKPQFLENDDFLSLCMRREFLFTKKNQDETLSFLKISHLLIPTLERLTRWEIQNVNREVLFRSDNLLAKLMFSYGSTVLLNYFDNLRRFLEQNLKRVNIITFQVELSNSLGNHTRYQDLFRGIVEALLNKMISSPLPEEAIGLIAQRKWLLVEHGFNEEETNSYLGTLFLFGLFCPYLLNYREFHNEQREIIVSITKVFRNIGSKLMIDEGNSHYWINPYLADYQNEFFSYLDSQLANLSEEETVSED